MRINLTQRTRRRQLVKGALLLTQGTPLAPTFYERLLLSQFIRGTLTIEQVAELTTAHRCHLAAAGW